MTVKPIIQICGQFLGGKAPSSNAKHLWSQSLIYEKERKCNRWMQLSPWTILTIFMLYHSVWKSQKSLIKNHKVWEQTVLPDRSILIGQKLMKNAQIEKWKWDIFSDFQTLCFISNRHFRGILDSLSLELLPLSWF